jgi:hypothetical protein
MTTRVQADKAEMQTLGAVIRRLQYSVCARTVDEHVAHACESRHDAGNGEHRPKIWRDGSSRGGAGVAADSACLRLENNRTATSSASLDPTIGTFSLDATRLDFCAMELE